MDSPTVVADEGAAMGTVAFCTPAPRAAKRRPCAGEDAAETRPFWSQSRCAKSRIGAAESEKDSLQGVPKARRMAWPTEGESVGAPISRNDEWLAKKKTDRSAE